MTTEEAKDHGSSSLSALRELALVIPPYSSPARIWASKVRSLLHHLKADQHLIADLVKSRLPDKLFMRLQDFKTGDVEALLGQISKLDQESRLSTTSRLLNEKTSLTHMQKPSELYYNILENTKQALPLASDEAVTEVARAKLLAALPPSAQAIQLAQDANVEWMKVLDLLDTVTAVPAATLAANINANNVQPQDKLGLYYMAFARVWII